MTITREEAKLLLIRPTVSSNIISEAKAREIEAYNMAIEALSERTGEWIFEETDEYKRTYCSVCGGSAPFVLVSDDHYGRRTRGVTRKTDFCPNCGADMRGEKK